MCAERVAAQSARLPPTQKPTVPTPPSSAGRSARYLAAPAMSRAAWSIAMPMSSLPARSGSAACTPWYRSGARAANPAPAKRSATALMCGTRPHHSWMTITPGPGFPGGVARYPTLDPPSVGYRTSSPIGPSSRSGRWAAPMTRRRPSVSTRVATSCSVPGRVPNRTAPTRPARAPTRRPGTASRCCCPHRTGSRSCCPRRRRTGQRVALDAVVDLGIGGVVRVEDRVDDRPEGEPADADHEGDDDTDDQAKEPTAEGAPALGRRRGRHAAVRRWSRRLTALRGVRVVATLGGVRVAAPLRGVRVGAALRRCTVRSAALLVVRIVVTAVRLSGVGGIRHCLFPSEDWRNEAHPSRCHRSPPPRQVVCSHPDPRGFTCSLLPTGTPNTPLGRPPPGPPTAPHGRLKLHRDRYLAWLL